MDAFSILRSLAVVFRRATELSLGNSDGNNRQIHIWKKSDTLDCQNVDFHSKISRGTCVARDVRWQLGF